MDRIVGHCRRRGVIFQSSEIYGGINGFFDYGPVGVELRRNIKEAWWHDMVQLRDDIVGLDSSIIMHGDVWKTSGHADGFADPMVDCRESKLRYKADQIFFSDVVVDGETIGYVSVLESPAMNEEAQEKADRLKRKLSVRGQLDPINLRDFTKAKVEEIELIPSPARPMLEPCAMNLQSPISGRRLPKGSLSILGTSLIPGALEFPLVSPRLERRFVTR